MAREDKGTNIDPWTVQNVARGELSVRYTVKGGQDSKVWFGPMNPLPPFAQNPEQQAIARAWDYPVGYNQRTAITRDGGISFAQLRALAENLDVLRLVIEKRKDQVESYEWEIMPIDGKAETPEEKSQVARARAFFEQPSSEYDWLMWLRASLEDIFVLDAWAMYPRYFMGGDLYSLDLIDGGTIKRVLDATGRTPIAPDVAYQQILHGVPAVDYAANELLYTMRNPRTNRVYGYSPVEQIIMTVNIALRKQLWQLNYFTEGNIPEAISGLPEAWNLEQVKTFQTYWDSLMEGNLAQRRHMRFVPFDPTKIKETRQVDLKDMYDEWLARVVCFAFSIPPTPFVKETNRSVAEQVASQAKEEGIIPILNWLKRRFDYILRYYLRCELVQFKWKMDEKVDAAAQAQIDREDYKAGLLTHDEWRERRGLDPLGIDEAIIVTPSGPMPLSEAIERSRDTLNNPPEPPPVLNAPQATGGDGGGDDTSKGKSAQPEKPEKGTDGAKGVPAKLGKLLGGADAGITLKKAISRKAERQRVVYLRWLEREVHRTSPMIKKFLKQQAPKIADTVVDSLKKAGVFSRMLKKADDIDRAIEEVSFQGWHVIADELRPKINGVYMMTAKEAVRTVGGRITPDITNQLDEEASAFAKERAAQLVGMMINDEGETVKNPDPAWSISETTRKRLRATISEGVDEGMSPQELKDSILDSFTFSDARAEMIARTELAFAHVQGNMAGWRESGVVVGKQSILGSEHDIDDICNDNADAGVLEIDAEFPSGDDGPPYHPNCVCDVIPITEGEVKQEETE